MRFAEGAKGRSERPSRRKMGMPLHVKFFRRQFLKFADETGKWGKVVRAGGLRPE